MHATLDHFVLPPLPLGCVVSMVFGIHVRPFFNKLPHKLFQVGVLHGTANESKARCVKDESKARCVKDEIVDTVGTRDTGSIYLTHTKHTGAFFKSRCDTFTSFGVMLSSKPIRLLLKWRVAVHED